MVLRAVARPRPPHSCCPAVCLCERDALTQVSTDSGRCDATRLIDLFAHSQAYSRRRSYAHTQSPSHSLGAHTYPYVCMYNDHDDAGWLCFGLPCPCGPRGAWFPWGAGSGQRRKSEYEYFMLKVMAVGRTAVALVSRRSRRSDYAKWSAAQRA